jgi:hypothetical protein
MTDLIDLGAYIHHELFMLKYLPLNPLFLSSSYVFAPTECTYLTAQHAPTLRYNLCACVHCFLSICAA